MHVFTEVRWCWLIAACLLNCSILCKSDRMSQELDIRYPASGIMTSHPEWRNMRIHYNNRLSDSSAYGSLMMGQFAEDIYIYETWFYGMQHGIVLESGALNGMRYSSTFMLQYFAHWFPIHIEASPSNFEELVNHRNDSININAALCSSPQTLHYTDLSEGPAQGILEFMEPKNCYQWYILPQLLKGKRFRISPTEYTGIVNNNISAKDWSSVLNRLVRSWKPRTVPCLAVSDVLRALIVGHIDVWVLDIEGAEYEALMGVDWDKVSISTIVMECDGINPDKDGKKVSLLEGRKYSCEKVTNSCFCKHESFVPSSRPSGRSSQYKHLYLTALRRNFRYIFRDPRLLPKFKSMQPLLNASAV